MKKSQRIQTLVDIKAAQAKSALEALGVSQCKWLSLQNQIQGLKDYRMQYQTRLERLGSGGTSVSQWVEFKSFIDKLDKAIAGQELALQGLELELKNKKQTWENLHYRTQGLQKVSDSAANQELKIEEKREQQLLDERAGRLGRSVKMA